MSHERQPYHAHIYFESGERAVANRLQQRLAESKLARVLFVGGSLSIFPCSIRPA